MTDHYYSEKPGSGSARVSFIYPFMGHEIHFTTDSGVFSKGEMDKGTELMLPYLLDLSGEVLDLGCGWGAIGVALLKQNPHLCMTMADINERALSLTQENLRKNNVQAETLKSDGFEALSGRRFDAIVLNPPIRAGKQVVYKLFENSREHLKPGGSLTIVIRKRQGADSAIRYLKTCFNDVKVLKKSGGYDIIRALGTKA